jgi:hypothetical protein
MGRESAVYGTETQNIQRSKASSLPPDFRTRVRTPKSERMMKNVQLAKRRFPCDSFSSKPLPSIIDGKRVSINCSPFEEFTSYFERVYV